MTDRSKAFYLHQGPATLQEGVLIPSSAVTAEDAGNWEAEQASKEREH